MLEQADSDNIIAVIGGRFLPVTRRELNVESDVQKVQRPGSYTTDKVKTAESINGWIATGRRPMIRDEQKKRIFIYTSSKQLILRGASLRSDVHKSDSDVMYKVMFDSISYTIQKR